MKKLLCLVVCLVLAMSLVFISGCNNQGGNENSTENSQSQSIKKDDILIAVPDGAPTLAIYEMLKTVTEIDGHKVSYKIVGGNENIGTLVSSGEADVAVLPTNTAAKLYNKGVKIKLATVNIFGVLYMIGLDTISSINDLKGQIVSCTAAGGTPDVALRMILTENNIEYVESDTAVSGKVAIKYVQDGSGVIAQMKTSSVTGVRFGVLGEPAVTQAIKVLSGSIAVDFQAEMDKILTENSFMQAGVVFSEKVYNDESLATAILNQLSSNKTFLSEDVANIKSVLIEKGSSLNVDFTANTLNRCNIDSIRANTLKTKIEAYFNTIKTYDSTFIGGNVPNEAFYY